MKITWKDQDTDLVYPLMIEKKIDIFYQQILGWQLHVADLIVNGGEPLGSGARVECIDHSGFAVLQICLSYLETIGKYRELVKGEKQYGAIFRAGAQDVFPNLKKAPKKMVDALYYGARCGLYHNSRTARGVGLGQPPDGSAIAYDPVQQTLVLSPERLPKALKSHLEGYRAELLDSDNVHQRQCFERQFDKDFGL